MPQRTMPARRDNWRPVDRIYDGILERCVADAEAGERRDGTSELMAGAVVLGVLAVAIMAFSRSAQAAIFICGVLAAALFCFVVGSARHENGDRRTALLHFGGPGRMPAGYLVHPTAWKAGMAEHVAHIPESQLTAAAELCHMFPGTVDDLITYVGNIAIHRPLLPNATPTDVERRAKELVRVGRPILTEYAKTAPALPTPGEPGKKTK
jgi:hypothetical protein